MPFEKTFHATLTILKSVTISAGTAKELLGKPYDYELTDADWSKAAQVYIDTYIEQREIYEVNDVEIEEVV